MITDPKLIRNYVGLGINFQPVYRGVQNNPKPKTRTENPVPEPNFRVPAPKYLIFFVWVPEPIFLGYRFEYGSDSLTKRYPKTRIFFYF